MIFDRVGSTIQIDQFFIKQAEAQIKGTENRNARVLGLALDSQKKIEAHQVYDAEIPNRYDAYDYSIGNVKYEIKTTTKNSFTISPGEYESRRKMETSGEALTYLFYDIDQTQKTATFIGCMDAHWARDQGLFQMSNHVGFYIFRDHVVKYTSELYQSQPG